MERVTRAQANAGRTACTICHRRKVKCDAHDVGFPCSNCRSAAKSNECHLHQKRRRVSRLKASSSVVASPAIAMAGSPTPVVNDSSSEPREIHTRLEQQQQQHQQQQQRLPQREEPSPRITTSLAGLPHDSADFERYLVEFIDQPSITQRPIDKDARIAYIGTDLSNINFLLRQQLLLNNRNDEDNNNASRPGSPVDIISHYPTNRIARHHTCHEPDRLPVEAFQLPPKAEVDRLLAAYFRHINPGFPVVDQETFMTQYRVRDARNPPSLLLLHSILVAAAHVVSVGGNNTTTTTTSSPAEAEIRESQKRTFFRRAKMLFDARFERNRDSVVQAALLLTWHTDGAEDVLANAWFWVGVAVRTAHGLGMHRDAEGSKLVGHNKRSWRRLWWLLVQCDVVVAMQYGRPLMIDLGESDVGCLRRKDFEGCGEGVNVEYCIKAAELCVVLAKGVKGLSRLSATREEKSGILREVDEELAGWMLRLPRDLDGDNNDNNNDKSTHSSSSLSFSSGITDPWAASLQIQYNAALILLHRRQPGREDSDICTTAAVTIQQTFQLLCERGQDRYLWISSVNCLFAALIQLSVDVRISNPILAISAFRRYDSALYCLERLAQYWPNALSILHFFQRSVPPGMKTSHGEYRETSGGTTNNPGRRRDGADIFHLLNREESEKEQRNNNTMPQTLDRGYHHGQEGIVGDHNHVTGGQRQHSSSSHIDHQEHLESYQNAIEGGSERGGIEERTMGVTAMHHDSASHESSMQAEDGELEHRSSQEEATNNIINSWQAWQRNGGQLQDLTEEWLFTY